ncbi:nucleoside hydrolase [Paenibacillus ginsengarvi]|uniref:Nucleoside hydrolase n=1 Tax=Paenibacillus ginsengarvi TaxID=400777 RepID=A0A3B0CHD6_9BACL|nr:nucleoside hydrolase [Paenibacillus ginsengarvi]RKN83737.1 nucleoside hydrolase [Paenibacillus ginsengarvi]
MKEGKAVSIILDTDIETDSDDVGAVAVLHALADQGEANILGMICSSPLEWEAPCLQALNTFYNRPLIPIGTLKVKDQDSDSNLLPYLDHVRRMHPQRMYNRYISQHYPNTLRSGRNAPDSTQVYRKLLSAQPDRSVTICAVGFLGPLSRLLQSGPDEWSEMNGTELVRRKVNLLVSMAIATFPEGKDRFNWKMDPESAEQVLSHWPTPIAVSEYGDHIWTGSRLCLELDEQHPVRTAYKLYLDGEGKSRSSWDQVAVLYAVRGTGDVFTEKTGYKIKYDAGTGMHHWHSHDEGSGDIYIKPTLSSEEMALRIENLMIAAKGPAVND